MSKVLPINEDAPARSWEVFAFARNVLGMPSLQRRFGNKSKTQLYRWGRNPECTSDSERNPIDWLRGMIEDLAEAGEQDMAEAVVRIIAEPLGVLISSPGNTEQEHDNILGPYAEIFKNMNLALILAQEWEHPNHVESKGEGGKSEIDTFMRVYRRLYYEREGSCAAKFSRREMSTPGFWERFLKGGNDHGINTEEESA